MGKTIKVGEKYLNGHGRIITVIDEDNDCTEFPFNCEVNIGGEIIEATSDRFGVVTWDKRESRMNMIVN